MNETLNKSQKENAKPLGFEFFLEEVFKIVDKFRPEYVSHYEALAKKLYGENFQNQLIVSYKKIMYEKDYENRAELISNLEQELYEIYECFNIKYSLESNSYFSRFVKKFLCKPDIMKNLKRVFLEETKRWQNIDGFEEFRKNIFELINRISLNVAASKY